MRAGADALRPKLRDQWRLRAPQRQAAQGATAGLLSQQPTTWTQAGAAKADGRGRRKVGALPDVDLPGSDGSELRWADMAPLLTVTTARKPYSIDCQAQYHDELDYAQCDMWATCTLCTAPL